MMGSAAAGPRRFLGFVVVCSIGLTLTGLLAAAASSSKPRAAAPQIEVATTGHGSELVKTLPITRTRGGRPRVVMSLDPRSLPDILPGDHLRVSAEFQVTGDCVERSTRCVGSPYDYAPRIRAQLVLASDPRTIGGPAAVPLGEAQREQCTQRHPQYEHHCVLVFDQAGIEISTVKPLPCPFDACFVNLVAEAYHHEGGPQDLLMVGGLKPNGKIPQDRGRINTVRYRNTLPSAYAPTSTTQLNTRSLRPNFRRRVVISQRLDGLREGEQIAVAAEMRTDVSHLPYAVRTSSRLILADSPRATEPDEFVKARASLAGEIAENNGSNCTQDEGRCTTRKVGVLEIRGDAVNGGGRPRPMFVNLVTVLGPKAPQARGRDRVFLRRGEIKVLRFAPELNG